MFVLKRKHEEVVTWLEDKVASRDGYISILRNDMQEKELRITDLEEEVKTDNFLIENYEKDLKVMQDRIEELENKLASKETKLSVAYTKITKYENGICVNKLARKQLRDLCECKDIKGNKVKEDGLIMLRKNIDVQKVYDLCMIF